MERDGYLRKEPHPIKIDPAKLKMRVVVSAQLQYWKMNLWHGPSSPSPQPISTISVIVHVPPGGPPPDGPVPTGPPLDVLSGSCCCVVWDSLLQGRALSAILGLIGRLIELWERLTRVWAAKWTPAALVRSIAHRQAV